MAPRNRSEPLEKRNGRERPNARGEATRLEILLKAEQLFAEQGISAVPLRDIGLAAGQKNNVAVQYHFGDRESLVREITVFRSQAGEEIRTELLAELISRPEPATVRDIVEVFVRALACHFTDDNHYLAFLCRYAVSRGGYAGLEGTPPGSSIHTLMVMLRRLLPDLPDEVVDERWMVMMTSAVHSLARYQGAARERTLDRSLEDIVEELVTFFSAAIAAPSLIRS